MAAFLWICGKLCVGGVDEEEGSGFGHVEGLHIWISRYP